MLTPFYRRAEFCGVRGRAAVPTRAPRHFKIHGDADLRVNLILSRFKATFPEYVGVLRGEYIAMDNGHVLLDPDGEMIIINCSTDDIWAARDLNEILFSVEIQQEIVELRRRWNQLPIATRATVISHPFPDNYYHFCLDTITKFRFLDEFEVETLALPLVCLAKPFQRDLLSRTQGGRKILPITAPFRIRDPVLVHGYTSPNGLPWLRQALRLTPAAGSRRLYIHRTNLSRSTPGDCIAQTPEFRALLQAFGFETVDFGSGDLGIDRQVAMLEGAGVILGAHGASMTNTAFLQAPATIVELFGTHAFGGFMDIAAQLSLRYHGVLCWKFDDDANIVVDCAQLGGILDAVLGGAPSQAGSSLSLGRTMAEACAAGA